MLQVPLGLLSSYQMFAFSTLSLVIQVSICRVAGKEKKSLFTQI